MQPTLTVSLLQADLIWESPAANRSQFEGWLAELPANVDIVVLPEMFTTGFSMSADAPAETTPGPTFRWMQAWAERLDAVLCGSIIATDGTHRYNRLIWMPPDGQASFYDKRHLFTLAGEEKRYRAGQERLLVEWRGWKIMPLICYDLRFPVWSRNDLAYDLLLYVANFPDKRGHAWRTLLQARAIENQCYTIGLNRVGTDASGIYYAGDSCIQDYTGHPIAHLPAKPMHQTSQLDYQAQQVFRQKLAFLKDQDRFDIEI